MPFFFSLSPPICLHTHKKRHLHIRFLDRTFHHNFLYPRSATKHTNPISNQENWVNMKKFLFKERCGKLNRRKQHCSRGDGRDRRCCLLVWTASRSPEQISVIFGLTGGCLVIAGSRDFSLLTPLSSPHSATLEISLFCLQTAPSAIIRAVEQPREDCGRSRVWEGPGRKQQQQKKKTPTQSAEGWRE